MPVTINNFTYTNGNSGRTRVNEQGLIVGVDFSLTSNPIGTGPRTFVLAADLGVNRDWPVGSSLVAVAQAGATGSLIGTVTSYVASTQTLVMEVASVTGSGTGTNWRIGSTMVRELTDDYDFRTYNPLTMQPAALIEGGATNQVLYSQDATNGYWSKFNLTASISSGMNYATANLIQDSVDGAATLHQVSRAGVNTSTTGQVWGVVFKKTNHRYVYLAAKDNVTTDPNNRSAIFDLDTGTVASNTNLVGGAVSITPVGNGEYLCQISTISTGGESLVFAFGIANTATTYAYQGSGARTVLVTGFQSEVSLNNFRTSYIPTTTVSVTRAADQLSIGGTNFSQFYNSAQGTLVFEATPIAQAVGAVLGSLNDGTLNNAIRIQQKQSGTLSSIRKMATDGVTDLMALDGNTLTLRSNGVDYTQASNAVSGGGSRAVSTSSAGNFLLAGLSEVFANTADSGATFTERNITNAFAGAHFGIGRFVLAGAASTVAGVTRGSVIVSTDGLALRRVNIPGLAQQLNEITSNGVDQYVAVGAGGVIYTSPDAETWTAQVSGTATNLTAAAYFSGRYVVTSATANASRYSDNGTSWTTVTGLAAGMNDVAHNGTNLWVAVGAGGAIYSSTDGINYTVRTSNTTANLNGIHFADGLWVAGGDNGNIVTSPDGITWTNRTATSGTGQNIQEIGFFNGKFYMARAGVSVTENSAANIVANVIWTNYASNVTAQLNGIVTNGTRLLLCGTNGAIISSEDGQTYTSRTGNAATLNGAAFGNGTYVVVGNAQGGSGLIATVNPTTFEYQRRASGTTNTINDVAFLNSAFYAPHTAGIQRSTDGQTYTSHAIGGTSFTVNRVTYDGTRHIAVGSGGRYSLSTDNGLTWAASALNGATTQNLNGLESFGGTTVAVGNAGVIITTTNGTTWTLRTSGVTSTLHSVMYSTRDNQWYAAGDGGVILRSADAITWTSISNDATVGIFTAGALQANPLAGKFIPNVKNRVAIGWTSTGGVSISINGGDVVTDPSVTMPVLTQYSVGMNGLSGQHWNSTIKTQRAYRVRVSDDELKALSRV